MADIETGPSRRAQSSEGWDPDWIQRRFSAQLVCTFEACEERVAIFGNSSVDEENFLDHRGNWDRDYISYFAPAGLHPAPSPIAIPAGVPEQISDRLTEAAALIWRSSDSAANQLRQAVERLLDHKRVRKTITSKQGRRKRLPLHDRIKEFEASDQANAELLLAIKWLGNTGSHSEGMHRKQVLDGFDIIELVLKNMFDRSEMEVLKKARGINKRKGPA
ncbi:DUF4145 domain-containing protein [Erythrobacter sp. W53]|uniref:DUF4145 domain-containing protein n=1 Tax=Erythrobacter sp. W53 TaxID=3425947 RepID=UPI003D766EC7